MVDGDVVNDVVSREGGGVVRWGPPIECSVEDNMEGPIGYEQSGRGPSPSGVIKMAVHEPGDGSSVPLNSKHVELVVEVYFGLCGIGVDTMSTIPLVHRTRVPPVVRTMGSRNVTMATMQELEQD